MGDLVRLPQPRTGRFTRVENTARARGRLGALTLLDEWSDWQYAQGMSDNTVAARTRRLRMFAQMIGDPLQATADDVVAYMASLPRDLKKSSRSTYYSHIRAFYSWLVVTGRRDDDPTMRVPSPRAPRREPRPVTEGQLDLILRVRMHKRTRMMVLLAAFQGLRAHEIAKVRGEDFDLTAMQLQVLGKGQVDRTLPLHPIVAEYSRGFPARGYWFPAPKSRDEGSGHLLPRSVSDIVGDVLRRAGVASGGAHRLRHTYATRLVRDGVNLRVVQELLRHASLQTTQIYTGVTFEQQQEAIRRLRLPDEGDGPAAA